MRHLATLAFLSALSACGGARAATVRTPADPRGVIDAWLLCEECVDGELAAVLALGSGPGTRGAAVEQLSEGLLAGPSPARVANVRQQFLESFEADSAYGMTVLGVPPVTTLAAYMDHYLENFIAVFRARSAIALARIGGPRARATLDSAIAGGLRDPDAPLREDVRASLMFARDSLLAP